MKEKIYGQQEIEIIERNSTIQLITKSVARLNLFVKIRYYQIGEIKSSYILFETKT